MFKLETHFYDHKLSNDQLNNMLQKIHLIPNDVKAAGFEEFKKKLEKRDSYTTQTKRNLEIVLHDFQHQPHKNYDHTNDLHADDLLYFLSELALSEDLMDLVNMQFEEMTGGLCPQGRTHRLYQLAMAFL